MPYRTKPPDDELAEILARVRARFAEVEDLLFKIGAPRVDVGLWTEVKFFPAQDGVVDPGICLPYTRWRECDDEHLCEAVRLLPRLLKKARKLVARRARTIHKARAELERRAAEADKWMSQ